MGQYVLRTNIGAIPFPQLENITIADGWWYDYSDIDGTPSNPSPVFYCSNDPQVYFHGIANQNSEIGSNINGTYTTSGVTLTSYYPSICIMAYLTGSEEEHNLRLNIVLVNGSNDETVIANIKNHRNENILYANDWEDAIGNVISYEDSWDETPSEDSNDPLNLESRGGEFADRGDFYDTDLMTLQGLPDPENDQNLYYGSMIACYNLSASKLSELGNALFLPNFWTSLKNKFAGLSDPLSFILEAFELPFTPDVANTARFKLGGLDVTDSEGHPITCRLLTNRYKRLTARSITLKEIWGSSKDYSDTSIQIYLPYAGMQSIDPDIAIGGVLTLIPYIDYWNGDLLYLLHIKNNKYFETQHVTYHWTGNCGKKIPLGKVDTSSPILQAIGTLGKIATGFAVGGAGGAVIAGASGIWNANYSPLVQTSGALNGSIGRMDYQNAYLVVKRGVPKYPNNWRSEIGAPRYQEFQVSDLSGYTEFFEIHADDVSDATDSEKAEIENLLKSGVLIA